MDNYNKYLKYKVKYLQLKNKIQLGGTPDGDGDEERRRKFAEHKEKKLKENEQLIKEHEMKLAERAKEIERLKKKDDERLEILKQYGIKALEEYDAKVKAEDEKNNPEKFAQERERLAKEEAERAAWIKKKEELLAKDQATQGKEDKNITNIIYYTKIFSFLVNNTYI